jgi:hypothetical protein
MNRVLLTALGASDTPEGRGRMAHLITTAIDLEAAQVPVEVYFAGIGVTWLAAFDGREHPFTQHYGDRFDAIRPSIIGACDFCTSVRFKTADSAARLGIPLLGDGGHASLASKLVEGFQIVNF